jgi:hypothetical protein
MSISSSMQQLAGGVASACAGLLVTQSGDGPLAHYERLGYVVATAMAVTVLMMARIDAMVRGDAESKPLLAVEPPSSAGSPRRTRAVGMEEELNEPRRVQ